MSIFSISVIGLGLSMDAFAAAICKGLSLRSISVKKSAIVAMFFGFFQALMPTIGYFLGSFFADSVTAFDHWIAFFLLGIIGANMVWESREEHVDASYRLDVKSLILVSIATSIDAFAVGVTFAFLKVNVLLSVVLIGLITFAISFCGVRIGKAFGAKYKQKAEFVGGVLLIFMGLKILLTDLGWLPGIF